MREHLRVRRVDASHMLVHCSKSSNKSCRLKVAHPKAIESQKKSRNEHVMHILMLGGQKHDKKFLDHLVTHEHHPAHA